MQWNKESFVNTNYARSAGNRAQPVTYFWEVFDIFKRMEKTKMRMLLHNNIIIVYEFNSQSTVWGSNRVLGSSYKKNKYVRVSTISFVTSCGVQPLNETLSTPTYRFVCPFDSHCIFRVLFLLPWPWCKLHSIGHIGWSVFLWILTEICTCRLKP